jgi:predicted CoA-binding protein
MQVVGRRIADAENRFPLFRAMQGRKDDSMPLTRDEDIAALLTETRTIALVGASDRPDRPSYRVMRFLQDHGYRVIPVNPQITGEHVHGEYVWRELSQIGEPIDMVDIFRRPEAAGDAVDQAIAAGAKSVWMQLGVINEAAAARAEAAGLKVVMDRCPAIDIPRLGLPRIAES